MPDPRPCLACGHAFTPTHGSAVTCSKECSATHRRRKKQSYAKGPSYADSILKRIKYQDTARSGREFHDDDVPTIDGGLA